MKTLRQMIHEAETASARHLMRANALMERGRVCVTCGGGFLPRSDKQISCPSCNKRSRPSTPTL